MFVVRATGRAVFVTPEELSTGGRIPHRLAQNLAVPLIAAPMLRISGPELVIAVCRAGVIGVFPTANARSLDELDSWLTRITARTEGRPRSRRT